MTGRSERKPTKIGAARRIILQCIFWYLITAGIFAVGEVAIVSSNVDRDISERIQSIGYRVAPALSQAIWNLDDDLVSLILSGVVDDSAVRRTELLDERGTLSFSLDAPDIPAVGASDGAPHVFPLSYVSAGKKARPVGEMLVYPSASLRKARILDSVVFSLGRIALIVLILSIILSIAIEGGLGRPLREFARQISEVDPIDPRKTPIAFRKDPIGELALAAEAFNAMAGKVGATVAALNESRARLWSAFEESPISLWEEDFSEVKKHVDEAAAAGVVDWEAYFSDSAKVEELCDRVKLIDVNHATLKLLGVPEKRPLLGSLFAATEGQVPATLHTEFASLASGSLSWEGDAVRHGKDGRLTILHIRLVVVPGHEKDWSRVLLSMIDITELKNSESNLRKSLDEKELLLKEVHHRVKNNLQIICSLINLQSGTTAPDSEAAASLADIETRVWAMSLVHELLYENQDFAALDFPDYVRKLCERIASGYVDSPGRIRVEVDVEEDVRLPLEKAIPCGLLINELVVNSFKHAFPSGRRGAISVSMARIEGGSIRLIVADDGVGVADVDGLRKPGSIGFQLVSSLSRQLRGMLDVNGEG